MKTLYRSLTAAALVLGLSLGITGCDGQKTAAALVSTLGNAAASLGALEGKSDLAAKLQKDTAIASQQVIDWKSGTPAQNVISALNLVEDDLNLFPVSTQDQVLVDLAIGTVQSILALLPVRAADAVAFNAHAVPGQSPVTHRAVQLAHPPRSAKEFKAQWNADLASHPTLTAATIR